MKSVLKANGKAQLFPGSAVVRLIRKADGMWLVEWANGHRWAYAPEQLIPVPDETPLTDFGRKAS